MNTERIHVVTGGFGYTGKYIAQQLLAKDYKVRTLTNSIHRQNPFGDKVEAHPFNFDEPTNLTESLKGAAVLYNTYFVRFNYKTATFARAVDNTLRLFDCAKRTGVERIVHISITNPSEDSPFEYFRSKAKVEKALQQLGLSYCILRPAVIFGQEDVLINNIAWVLRRSPVAATFWGADSRIRPIHVEDLAKLAVEQGQNRENRTVDAVGPETLTYRGLARQICKAIGKTRIIMPVPSVFVYLVGRIIGLLLSDVFVTRDEIKVLMADLLHVDSPPTGETKLTEWIDENADTLGRRYASVMARRRDKLREYRDM
jgi:NADH dehydrogenase